jgi:hypothetical protein
MRIYLAFMTGILALGIEAGVFLSLMEMPPFGKGGSDIVWGLPFFGLVVSGIAMLGLGAATSAVNKQQRNSGLLTAGLVLNGLSLVIPVAALVFGIGRAILMRS